LIVFANAVAPVKLFNFLLFLFTFQPEYHSGESHFVLPGILFTDDDLAGTLL
jgi:hypothetical protein